MNTKIGGILDGHRIRYEDTRTKKLQWRYNGPFTTRLERLVARLHTLRHHPKVASGLHQLAAWVNWVRVTIVRELEEQL